MPEPRCTRADLSLADGARLALYLHGPHDPELVLILAHGWQATSAIWDKTVDQLAHPATLVVRYDQRGHGQSTTGTARPSIALLAHDLKAIIAATAPDDVPVVLVGHSMGGMAALALAADHPHLIGSKITAAVLVATSSGGLDLAAAHHPPLTRALGLLRHAAASMCVRAPAAALRLHNLWQPRLSTQPPIDIAAHWFKALMRHDVNHRLDVLQHIPVDILVGECDPTIPPVHSQRLAAQIPTARLRIVPGGCHRLPTRHASHVVAAVERSCRHALHRAASPSSPQASPARRGSEAVDTPLV
ncbi:alpha/beta fold hydrolase [Streptomyces sp. NPDC053474]|uniref:alpha/beta fold hydrolase n=1 Tax=Streptomyces sp. NPDC053474 TaxID=3365704 RepID=UPI0037D47E7F